MNERATIDPSAESASGQSTLKSILVHIQDDATLDNRLETALSLSRSAGAHLNCLHVTPIQAYAAFDSLGGVFVMKDVLDQLGEQERRLRERVEEKLRVEDVTWDYDQITGDVIAQIINKAALADLVVIGREPHRHDFAGSATGILGDLLQRARTPLFIPGYEKSQRDTLESVLIAWDGSYEAANAIRASLGLLKIASGVAIIHVTEDKEKAFPSTKVLEYLSRQGIHAELTVEDPPSADGDPEIIAASLVAYGRGIGATCIVMGGFGHNRVHEFVFGGVTRSLLKECPFPVVIAH